MKQSPHDEMHEIKRQLEQNEDMLKDIHRLLKGSAALDMEGVIPSLKRISNELDSISDWKNTVELRKGTINIKDVMKLIAWVVGIAGGVFGIFTAYYQIFIKT